jgi:hypothetical protein
MNIVEQTQQKIKQIATPLWIDSAMWIVVIVFISVSSFSLGILYERTVFRDDHPITITYNQQSLDLWNRYNSQKESSSVYFASKNGSIVYPIGCTKGDRIKEENKVFFNELTQALDLGYKKVEGC